MRALNSTIDVICVGSVDVWREGRGIGVDRRGGVRWPGSGGARPHAFTQTPSWATRPLLHLRHFDTSRPLSTSHAHWAQNLLSEHLHLAPVSESTLRVHSKGTAEQKRPDLHRRTEREDMRKGAASCERRRATTEPLPWSIRPCCVALGYAVEHCRPATMAAGSVLRPWHLRSGVAPDHAGGALVDTLALQQVLFAAAANARGTVLAPGARRAILGVGASAGLALELPVERLVALAGERRRAHPAVLRRARGDARRAAFLGRHADAVLQV